MLFKKFLLLKRKKNSSRYPFINLSEQWWWTPLNHPFKFMITACRPGKIFPPWDGFCLISKSLSSGQYPLHPSVITFVLSLSMCRSKNGLKHSALACSITSAYARPILLSFWRRQRLSGWWMTRRWNGWWWRKIKSPILLKNSIEQLYKTLKYIYL